jgi:hypothetical protein
LGTEWQVPIQCQKRQKHQERGYECDCRMADETALSYVVLCQLEAPYPRFLAAISSSILISSVG